MTRLFGFMMVSSLLLLGTGCALDVFRLGAIVSKGSAGHEVEGSLETVSTSTQGVLQNMGLYFRSTRDGDTVRLASQTNLGNRFTLVLKRMKSTRGERTHLHIEWEKTPEEEFWLQLVAAIVRGEVSAQVQVQAGN